MGPDEATDLIVFAGMLLKFIYEFPARVRPPTGADSKTEPDGG